jgi:hypothetical protein
MKCASAFSIQHSAFSIQPLAPKKKMALPGFAKKHGHFEQELSILLVSTIDGNS